MPTKALRFVLIALVAVFAIGMSTLSVYAQDEASTNTEPLTVGVYVHPPFVIETEDGFSGMAVELWQWLAGQLGFESNYVEFSNVGELADAAEAGEVDVAVTNMTVIRERAERMDFTHPWFDAGQRIMVRDNAGGGISNLIAGLNESGHLRAYAWIGIVIIIATILVTLFDRRFDKDFPSRWRDGLAEGFYTVMSVTTSGKPPARKNLFGWIGRFWQGLWLVCGIAVLAYVTSSVTSVMMMLSLTSQINSVADLPGRLVGVQPGSVSEDYARQAGLNIRHFDHITQAAEALVDGRIDAIVGDAPVLEYYAHAQTQLPVIVVGPIFAPDKYAFALPRESELTRQVSVELIGAHESGWIEGIRTRYFGESQ